MHRASYPKNDGSARRRITGTLAITFAGLVGVLVLGMVRPEQLDEMPRLCLWSRLLGGPCPACGTLHALSSLVHGDLAGALAYNRNVAAVVPVLAWVWVSRMRAIGFGQPVSSTQQPPH